MKKLLEYSALIYATLIFLGYSYIEVYYYSFGLSIYSYLDASEILLSFLNRITFLGLLIISFIICSLIGFAVSSFKWIKKKKILPQTEVNPKTKENNTWLDKIMIFFVFLILAIFTLHAFYTLIYRSLYGSFYQKVIIFMILLFAVSVFIYYKLPKIFKELSIDLSLMNQRIFYCLFIVCLFNYILATFEYHKVCRNVDNIRFSFNYESKEYKSCDSLRYIGATSKYVFVWNLVRSDNYIFLKDDLKNFRIKIVPAKINEEK